MKTLLLSFSLLLIAFILIGCDETEGPTGTGTWTCDNKILYVNKIYNTVQIGNQCWLKENLDIGRMIQGVDTSKDNGIIERYCYNNNPRNCETYGGLYTWDESMQYTRTEGAQGICPNGWHIPTIAEYETLKAYVGGDGNALKAMGQGSDSGVGTNISGFSSLCASYRENNGNFIDLFPSGSFWSSTDDYWGGAYIMLLYHYNSYINLHYSFIKDYAYSIRCLKD